MKAAGIRSWFCIVVLGVLASASGCAKSTHGAATEPADVDWPDAAAMPDFRETRGPPTDAAPKLTDAGAQEQ